MNAPSPPQPAQWSHRVQTAPNSAEETAQPPGERAEQTHAEPTTAGRDGGSTPARRSRMRGRAPTDSCRRTALAVALDDSGAPHCVPGGLDDSAIRFGHEVPGSACRPATARAVPLPWLSPRERFRSDRGAQPQLAGPGWRAAASKGIAGTGSPGPGDGTMPVVSTRPLRRRARAEREASWSRGEGTRTDATEPRPRDSPPQRRSLRSPLSPESRSTIRLRSRHTP